MSSEASWTTERPTPHAAQQNLDDFHCCRACATARMHVVRQQHGLALAIAVLPSQCSGNGDRHERGPSRTRCSLACVWLHSSVRCRDLSNERGDGWLEKQSLSSSRKALFCAAAKLVDDSVLTHRGLSLRGARAAGVSIRTRRFAHGSTRPSTGCTASRTHFSSSFCMAPPANRLLAGGLNAWF